MRSDASGRGDRILWDVATPARRHRVPGVAMAGFGDLGRTPVGLRMIPHPAVTLAFMFGSGSITVADATGRQHRGSLVAGLGFESVRVRQVEDHEGSACLQVRLSPVVARAVLGASPADLGSAVLSLDDVWGRATSRIAEQLGGASSWAERFALADTLIAGRCETTAPVDPEVARAWDRIVVSRGLVRIDRLAAELGWSRKRLWSRFHAQIGLSPKRAATLVRFDHAAHRLVDGLDTARVAADAGYADQSHLHRDVATFSGVTPAALSGEPFLTVDATAWPGNGTRA